MKTRAVLLGLVVLTSACTTVENTDATVQTTSTVEGVPPSTAVSRATTTTHSISEPPRLLINEPSGAVVVTDIDGVTLERLDPPEGAIYTQPIWTSPDTIVFSQAAQDDNRLEARRIGGTEVWSVPLDTHPFFYLAAPGSTTPTVLSLRNNTDRPGLITERISGPASISVVSVDSPFYASWSPVDGRFASHVGDERLDITGGSTETVSTASEGFQAPVWLNGGVVALRNEGGDTLLSQWIDGSFTDIARVNPPARFVASGDLIAIMTGGAAVTNGVQASAQTLATIPAGVLTVVDLADESFTTVSVDPSAVFQWSPDAKRLVYATFINDPAPAVVWHSWEDGDVTDFEPFIPEASWFATFVPFFDQYAQSVSLWSPDGTAFAYPATVAGQDRILVQHLSESGPRDVAAGSWVAWSPSS